MEIENNLDVTNSWTGVEETSLEGTPQPTVTQAKSEIKNKNFEGGVAILLDVLESIKTQEEALDLMDSDDFSEIIIWLLEESRHHLEYLVPKIEQIYQVTLLEGFVKISLHADGRKVSSISIYASTNGMDLQPALETLRSIPYADTYMLYAQYVTLAKEQPEHAKDIVLAAEDHVKAKGIEEYFDLDEDILLEFYIEQAKTSDTPAAQSEWKELAQARFEHLQKLFEGVYLEDTIANFCNRIEPELQKL